MNVSEPFIRRPIGTSLLAIALLLAGIVAYRFLPVAPLPQVEFPVIQVQASMPGASPETMASAVATPLERQFGRIAGVSEMTSTSVLGATNVTLQFELSRSIDHAARDVQAAINAARSQLPTALVNNPTYRKVNPADAPIMIITMTSDTMPIGKVYDAGDSILAQKLAQVEGIGQVFVGGGAKPAVRAQVDPNLLARLGIGLEQVRDALQRVNANTPKGELANRSTAWAINANDQLFDADQYRPVIVAYQNGAPVRLGDVAEVVNSVEDIRAGGIADGKRAVLLVIYRQPGANIIETCDRVYALFPVLRERRRQIVRVLSGGQQQMVAVGRALMSAPRLLMLDEPSLGIAPRLVAAILDALTEINRGGVGILLVEQNVPAALSLAHRAYVIEGGRIVREGTGAALLQDAHVRRAYLGPLAR